MDGKEGEEDGDDGLPDGNTGGNTDAGTTDAGSTDAGTTDAGDTAGGTGETNGAGDGGTTGTGTTDGSGTTDGGTTGATGDDGSATADCVTDADCPADLICTAAGFCEPEGGLDGGTGGGLDGGTIGDTGTPPDDFDITAECTGELYPGTTAVGSLRDWTGGGGTINFTSAAWRWDGATNTARVLITQEEDSCGDVIGTVTAGTYTGAAAYLEISGWEDLGPGSHTVPPIGGASSGDGPLVSAAGYFHNGTEGTSWPLDGFTGSFETPTYGSISVMFIDEGTNFEATVRLYGGGPGEGVDGTFNACYCDAFDALVVPSESFDGGGVPADGGGATAP